MCNEKKEFVLSKQILRSGTGIGANLAEAECAISRKDFLSKIYIALKECSEPLYWLDLLRDTSFLTEEMHASIYRDGEELKRLLTSTTKRLPGKSRAILQTPFDALHAQLSTFHPPLSIPHFPAQGL